MSEPIPPLSSGTLLGERFEIAEHIASGRFGLGYIGRDLRRGDRVFIKELAPLTCASRHGDLVSFEGLSPSLATQLRRQFVGEAKVIGKYNFCGVPSIRSTLCEFGTAYWVSELVEGADSLEHERRLDSDRALSIFEQLLDLVGQIHSRGLLHLNITPRHILVSRNGQVFLSDFGRTQQWLIDIEDAAMQLCSPGFAPIELYNERADRSPATDIYSLCACMYAVLVGSVPASAVELAGRTKLVSLQALRPDVDARLCSAIEAGLKFYASERPQSCSELRKLLHTEVGAVQVSSLDAHDIRSLKIRNLKFLSHECPSCGELIVRPKPLRLHECPVCRMGKILPRNYSHRSCPVCHSGVLSTVANGEPPALCPMCGEGRLSKTRLGFRSKLFRFSCTQCGADLRERQDGFVQVYKDNVEHGALETWTHLKSHHPRSQAVSLCDSCEAQFDKTEDSRWRQIIPHGLTAGHRVLYSDEWSRVAKGLDPGAGTHECDFCNADFFVEGEKLTLLSAPDDPHGFAATHVGRVMTWQEMRWLAVGKRSLKPGVVCEHCQTEFDVEQKQWRLVRTTNKSLVAWIDHLHIWADWHRLAQELPRIHETEASEEAIKLAIVDAYRQGEIDFDDKGTIWRGPAKLLASVDPEVRKLDGKLRIKDGTLEISRGFRTLRFALESFENASLEEGVLALTKRGEANNLLIDVHEIEMTVKLRSGDRTVLLEVADLAARLKHEIRP